MNLVQRITEGIEAEIATLTLLDSLDVGLDVSLNLIHSSSGPQSMCQVIASAPSPLLGDLLVTAWAGPMPLKQVQARQIATDLVAALRKVRDEKLRATN